MFISLEGPDGSGKSSQLPLLADWLRSNGYEVYTTREPGGTEIGNQIREIVLNKLENTAMHPRTEILLFLSSRAQLVEEIIRPLRDKGTIILCDRYADSTMAYQGYGHGVDLATLQNLLNFATGNLYPDLTLLLDVEAKTGLDRRKKNSGKWDRLDAFNQAFHERVRKGYLEMAAKEPSRWITVNADQSINEVQLALRQAIATKLPIPAKG